jgi:anti-sigma regulatory factor (Ser/Thr protein kinase)
VRSVPARRTRAFRHEAAFYRGLEDFTRTVAPFVSAGLAAGEPVLVVEVPDRIQALRSALGPASDEIAFLDMVTLGRNPARIIPAWRRFVVEHPGRPVRGVGEPVWPGRRPAELEECRLHESLLNVAFDEVGTEFRLLCPYDASTLSGEVLADAARTHPVVGSTEENPAYGGRAWAVGEFERPLPEPPAEAERIAFGVEDLAGLRSVVHRLCEMTSLAGDAVEDLVLATHELASNSVRHGGGEGLLRGWREPGALVLEVSDRGVIRDPLVGREEAPALAEGGRGVWMANQLCDLVQVRSSAHGTSVRLHSWLAGPGGG